MDEHDDVMTRVRRALRRTKPLEQPPVPPVIDPSVARLVHGNAGLSERFARVAAEMKMKVSQTSSSALPAKLVEFLRESQCRKVALAESALLERLGLLTPIRDAGIAVKRWSEMTLDELYDGYDAAVTDVEYAVAETGSLVVRPGSGHGRGLSLVPMIHVAIVEEKNLVADLVDLMEKLSWPDQSRSNVIMITGPSKTADIEMNVVTGVHGPNVVKVFMLQ